MTVLILKVLVCRFFKLEIKFLEVQRKKLSFFNLQSSFGICKKQKSVISKDGTLTLEEKITQRALP